MKPDYSLWDVRPGYTLSIACWLCCDLEPQNATPASPTPPKVRDMRALLLRGFPSRQYTRGGLREWAERTGQREVMPFLFPEDRTDAQMSGKPEPAPKAHPKLLSEREERWALEILAAVIEVKYGSGTVASLKQDRSPKTAMIARDVQKHFSARDDDSIRKYLKRLPDL